jgi:glycine/D-amino acid oxidase-like deaminating enzyme
VVVGAGCCGHGVTFATAIGRIRADLALDEIKSDTRRPASELA